MRSPASSSGGGRRRHNQRLWSYRELLACLLACRATRCSPLRICFVAEGCDGSNPIRRSVLCGVTTSELLLLCLMKFFSSKKRNQKAKFHPFSGCFSSAKRKSLEASLRAAAAAELCHQLVYSSWHSPKRSRRLSL